MCFVKVSLKEDQGGPSSVPSKKCQRIFFKCAPKNTNTSFEKGLQLYKKIKMGKTSFKEVLQVCQTNKWPKKLQRSPSSMPKLKKNV